MLSLTELAGKEPIAPAAEPSDPNDLSAPPEGNPAQYDDAIRALSQPAFGQTAPAGPIESRDSNPLASLGGPPPPPAGPVPAGLDPNGWYIETTTGLVGPMTSREVALKAYRDEISRQAVLFHPGRNARVLAGLVPFLFRKRRPPGTVGALSVSAGLAAQGASINGDLDPQQPVWLVETAGKTIGPLSTIQVERAARTGILSPESILTFPTKGIRVTACDVPRLFPGNRTQGPSAAPEQAAPAPPGQDGTSPNAAGPTADHTLCPPVPIPTTAPDTSQTPATPAAAHGPAPPITDAVAARIAPNLPAANPPESLASPTPPATTSATPAARVADDPLAALRQAIESQDSL